MALMKCPNCKNEVSNNISICPTCGCAVWEKKDEIYLSKIKEKNLAAVKEIKSKNYQTAIELLDAAIKEYDKFQNYLISANANVSISQTKCYDYAHYLYLNYGVIYSNCDSPCYNLEKAMAYFEKSGEMGHSNGYFQIASIYDPNFDIGKKENYKDIAKAKLWYKKAFNVDGDYYSLNNIGVLCGNNGDNRLGAFYCWTAYKLGNQGALNNYNTYINNLSPEYDKYFKSLSVTTNNISSLETAFLTWHQNYGKSTISKSVTVQNHIQKHKKKYIIGAIALFLAFIILLIAVAPGGGSGGDDGTVRCKSCYKSFDEGTSNANNIHRTNMCKKCYENYKWSQNAIDGLK